MFGAQGTGFTLQPPLEIGQMSRARRELRPRSAADSRLGLPPRTPISPRLNRASAAVMCLVRYGGSGETAPFTGHLLRLQRVVSDRRETRGPQCNQPVFELTRESKRNLINALR